MRWVEAAYRRGDLAAKRKALMSPPAVGVVAPRMRAPS